MGRYYHKNKDSAASSFIKKIPCDRWTNLTLACYKNKAHCSSKCEGYEICNKYNDKKTTLGIKSIKWAMLLTFAKLGKPKGM